MKGDVVVAVMAAGPPTVAALLAHLQARAARREAAAERTRGVAHALDVVGADLSRLEATVARIDGGVLDVRERLARLEGTVAALPHANLHE